MPIETVEGSTTCVYASSNTHDYESLQNRDTENAPKYLATGIGSSIIANRISWFYDFRGESLLVDTACSSSLSCLHLAARSLESGDSDMALVCGVNLIISPDSSFSHLSRMGFFSPHGHCYSFDDRANGYAKGEGAAVVILKRVTDAVRDGNTIRAILRATGSNQDGRTPGITYPSSEAQEANILRTYRSRGLHTDLTGYIEAHGTGTQVGDPLEAKAIQRAFERDATTPIYVGAVKGNIGHLGPVAGLAGLIKTVMILERGIIPPNPLYRRLGSEIPGEQTGLSFPKEKMHWLNKGFRRASLNSFGYGGTNTHAVLDDAGSFLMEHGLAGQHLTEERCCPDVCASKNADTHEQTNPHEGPPTEQTTRTPIILVWSAADKHGIGRLASALSEYANRMSEAPNTNALGNSSLRNASHALANKRSNLNWRAYMLTESWHDMKLKPVNNDFEPLRAGKNVRLILVFTGQGAQWPGMGKELQCYQVFAATLQKAERYLVLLESGFSLREELFRSGSESRIHEPIFSQTLCTVLQIAMVDLLRSWGIVPSAIIGHSSGEIAAAYCAGGLDFESAVKAAYFRGYHATKLIQSKTVRRSMLAISIGSERLKPLMQNTMAATGGEIVIACENSLKNFTISGDCASIQHLKDELTRQNYFCRELDVPLAYHSPHMRQLACDYRVSMANMQGIRSGPSSLRGVHQSVMFSTVTGGRSGIEELECADYWVSNAVSQVKFATAFKSLATWMVHEEHTKISRGKTLFLEIGPHSSLKRPINENIAANTAFEDSVYHHLLERDVSAVHTALNAVAKLRCHGLPVELNKVNYPDLAPPDFKVDVNLPQYPFNHSQKYWSEPRISRNYRLRSYGRHDLLGVQSSDWNPLDPHWRHFLKISESPWMQDHCMDSVNIYPAAGMIVMVVEAARQLANKGPTITGYRLNNIRFIQALKINTSAEGIETQLRFYRPRGLGSEECLEHDFALLFHANDSWHQVCSGSIAVSTMESPDHYADVANNVGHENVTIGNQQDSVLETVTTREFYNRMAACGCQFGPAHQTLSDICYSTDHPEAQGTILLDHYASMNQTSTEANSSCVIHPTALDGLVQLVMAAFSHGGDVPFSTMVPTQCRSLWLSESLRHYPSKANLKAYAQMKFQGFREALFTVSAFDANHKRQIHLEGWKQMAVTNIGLFESKGVGTRRMFYSLNWKMDIDLASAPAVQMHVDSTSMTNDSAAFDASACELLCMSFVSQINAARSAGEIFTGLGTYTQKYLDWAHRVFDPNKFEVLKARVPGGHNLTTENYIREKYLVNCSVTNPELALTICTGRRVLDVLRGHLDPLELIYQNDHIQPFYSGSSFTRNFEALKYYMDLLAHKNPNMKILEIGAGTGSITMQIINFLSPNVLDESRTALPRFQRYDVTDISASFFEGLRNKLSAQKAWMNFGLLDIEKDPLGQGFTSQSYDVIICGLVLHATSRLSRSLRHVRSLLRPGGKLIVLELTNVHVARIHFIFGLLPGWWLGEESFRENGPVVDIERWEQVFTANGFSKIEINVPDVDEASEQVCRLLVVAVEDPSERKISQKGTRLIVADAKSELQQDVVGRLKQSDSSFRKCDVVSPSELHMTKMIAAHLLVIVELDRSWVRLFDESEFENLKKLVKEADSCLWVTSGTGVSPDHPDRDLVSGFARNVRSESMAVKFTHLGLENLTNLEKVVNLMIRVQDKMTSSSSDTYEEVYRERKGDLFVGRVHESDIFNQEVHVRVSPRKPQDRTLGEQRDRAIMLSVGAPGLLDTLHFVDDPEVHQPLSPVEIDIRPVAVGLNFRDVLIALDMLAGQSFGFELAGIVIGAGQKSGFQVGDRVCAATTTGAFKSRVRTLASSAVALSAVIPFEEAAGIPIAFCTAYYSLVELANLKEGDSVLIHSGAGGLGQCAIQLAKYLNADIHTTVGTEEKKEFLVKTYGISRAQVYSSRDTSFKTQILEKTKGEGANIILNSLSGERMRASWECIAPLGRFVEVGKSDLESGRGLDMDPFLKNVSLMSVDLTTVMKKAPHTMARILTTVIGLYSAGKIHLPIPLRTFHAHEVEGAFRWMQGGKNFGKAVVTFSSSDIIKVSFFISQKRTSC